MESCNIWRIPDHSVEPGILLVLTVLIEKDLWELQFPVEEVSLLGCSLGIGKPGLGTNFGFLNRVRLTQLEQSVLIGRLVHLIPEVCGDPSVGHLLEGLEELEDVAVQLLFLADVLHLI